MLIYLKFKQTLKLLTILAIVSFIFFAGCKKDEYKATVEVVPPI